MRRFVNCTAAVLLLGCLACAGDVTLRGNATLRGNVVFAPAAAGGGGGLTAPTFVNANGTSGGSVATLALTYTIAAGANRLLCVNVAQGKGGGTPVAITSVTWEATTTNALTAIPGGVSTDTNFCHLTGYYLLSPEVFVNGIIRVTWFTTPDVTGILAANYTGAAQSSTFGTAVTGGSKTTATTTVTVTTGTGQINFGACSTDANGAITIGGTASPTSRFEIEGVSSDMGFSIGDCTGNGTFEWSWSGADNGWAMFAVPVNGL